MCPVKGSSKRKVSNRNRSAVRGPQSDGRKRDFNGTSCTGDKPSIY